MNEDVPVIDEFIAEEGEGENLESGINNFKMLLRYAIINEAIPRMQLRIFKYLKQQVLSRVPEDTSALYHAIERNSRIENNKVIVGSGTEIPYAYVLEHHFEDPENPRKMWPAKFKRELKGIFKTPSTIPYLRAAGYKGIKTIARIISEEIERTVKNYGVKFGVNS